ncbi:SLC13 family permease [Thermaurantimonas aggregans]|nr:SLC13 family permease [Thermaurantimonas aggregans]MCX8148726.1 SLC13 family permease [Thermaurantimonas aggregans]
MKNLLNIGAGFLGFGVVYVLLQGHLSSAQSVVVSLFAWMLIWWTNQVVHYSVTALLPIVVLPLFEVASLKEVTTNYSNPVIYLFFGGFLLALAVEKWDIHKRLALWLLLNFNKNLPSVFMAITISSYFLSMWMSNTATAIMMLPLATALVTTIRSQIPIADRDVEKMFLTIAFSANIGGIATIIGTPPNLVFSGFLNETFHQSIRFIDWFIVGFPISVLLLLLLFIVLVPKDKKLFQEDIRERIRAEYRRLPKMSSAQKRVLIVFSIVALLWFTAPFIEVAVLNDTSIAMAGAVVLFMLPSGQESSPRLLEWQDTKDLSWGILLLFGAGLTMASMFEKTGLSAMISDFFKQSGSSKVLLAVLIVAFTVFSTEFMSNVALTGLMMPAVAALASGDIHVFFYTGMSVAMASSCAFMLPIATPPNAVAFGSGQIRMMTMMRLGLLLNAVSILLFSVLLYLFVK